MDNLEKDNTTENEDGHAAEASSDQEINETESQQTGDANPDNGAENSEVGEGAGENGEGTEIESNSDAPAEETDPLEKISERFDKLEEKLEKKEEKPAVKELSPEEWQAAEEAWGIPKAAIKKFAEKQVYMYNRIMDAFDTRMARFEKTVALQDLSRQPGFTDAMKHSKEIDRFISDYDPKDHSNPELLKKAIFYARGLNMKNTIQKVRKEGDKNLRIAGAARPSSPNSNAGPRKGTSVMDETHRSALKAIGMDEAEAAKYKAMSRKPFF